MDEPVQTVNSIPYNIDGISAYKIKARNRVLLLEALKDGRKWNKIQEQNGQGLLLWDTETAQEVTHALILNAYFLSNSNIQIVQTLQWMAPASTAQPLGITNHAWWLYIAFSNHKGAYVYQCGNHTCTAKDIHKRSADTVKDVLSKDCNITPRQIQSMTILADLRSRKNWNEVKKNSRKVANVKALSNKMVTQKRRLYNPVVLDSKQSKNLKLTRIYKTHIWSTLLTKMNNMSSKLHPPKWGLPVVWT